MERLFGVDSTVEFIIRFIFCIVRVLAENNNCKVNSSKDSLFVTKICLLKSKRSVIFNYPMDLGWVVMHIKEI